MQLLIDQGNSSIKWCFYGEQVTEVPESSHQLKTKHKTHGHVSISDRIFPVISGSLPELEAEVKKYSKNISSVFISSVQKETQLKQMVMCIGQHTSAPVMVAETTLDYHGLTNAYANVEQMGVDRWLVMVACWQQFNSGFIVVDAGSAMTLDIVDKSGQHLGGHIIPGLALQKRALLSGTDRVNFDQQTKAIVFKPGISTNEAVQNGCLTVLSSYIEAMYHQYNERESLPLVLTGGDAVVLSEALNIEHEVIPGLVLKGLHYSFT